MSTQRVTNGNSEPNLDPNDRKRGDPWPYELQKYSDIEIHQSPRWSLRQTPNGRGIASDPARLRPARLTPQAASAGSGVEGFSRSPRIPHSERGPGMARGLPAVAGCHRPGPAAVGAFFSSGIGLAIPDDSGSRVFGRATFPG